jgi:hypothetical protein
MKVGDQVRFIPIENCACVHCAINISAFNSVFIVLAVRGQSLSLCQSGSTYREWLTDRQVTAPIDHVILANKRTSPITSRCVDSVRVNKTVGS